MIGNILVAQVCSIFEQCVFDVLMMFKFQNVRFNLYRLDHQSTVGLHDSLFNLEFYK